MGAIAPIIVSMNVFKLSSLILFYFFTRVVFAAPEKCQELKATSGMVKVCKDVTLGVWVSSECLAHGCAAKKFLQNSQKSELLLRGVGNPGPKICDHLKLKVEVLKDPKGSSQTYCVFKDGSLVEALALEIK
jgi:putative hemolysin